MRGLILALAATAGLTGCMQPENARVVTRLNGEAKVMGDLPGNPMKDKVITSWIDKRSKTMSTMYGNDAALEYARSGATAGYPAGSAISVVTWEQQEDPRWFGGNIPSTPRQVELVKVSGPGSFSYERYEGLALKRATGVDAADAKARGEYLLAQRAAVMP